MASVCECDRTLNKYYFLFSQDLAVVFINWKAHTRLRADCITRCRLGRHGSHACCSILRLGRMNVIVHADFLALRHTSYDTNAQPNMLQVVEQCTGSHSRLKSSSKQHTTTCTCMWLIGCARHFVLRLICHVLALKVSTYFEVGRCAPRVPQNVRTVVSIHFLEEYRHMDQLCWVIFFLPL